MKTAIITLENYENRPKDSVGSSRIRGTWLAENWPEAEMFRVGVKYDAIIFQKSYFLSYMKAFDGIKILDLCDPDWLSGMPVREAIEYCDAVTVSSEGLREFVAKMTDKPVIFIPDRVDLKYYRETKKHEGKAERVVWFGYSQNQTLIDGALATIKRLGLKLTVISDKAYFPTAGVQGIDSAWINANVTNIQYLQETINEEIMRGGDVVLNPKMESGRFKFKSENKSFSAWALGMPVAVNSADLERFIDPAERQKEAAEKRKLVEDSYKVELSVEQYKKLINEIAASKSKQGGSMPGVPAGNNG